MVLHEVDFNHAKLCLAFIFLSNLEPRILLVQIPWSKTQFGLSE